MENKGYKLLFRSVAVIVGTFICALIFNIVYQAQVYYTKLSKDSILTAFVFKSYESSAEGIKKDINALPEVKESEFVSSSSIYQNISSGSSKVRGILLNGENPFSPYFLVKLKETSINSVEKVKTALSKIKGIDEVRYDPKIFILSEKLNRIKNGYLGALFAAGAILFITLLARIIYELSNFYAEVKHFLFEIAWGTLFGFSGIVLYFLLSKFVSPFNELFVPLQYILIVWPVGILLNVVLKD